MTIYDDAHRQIMLNSFKSLSRLQVRMIFVFLVIGLHHNLILINEEILVALCFITALYFLYSNLGDSVTESLNERSQGIRQELTAFFRLREDDLRAQREALEKASLAKKHILSLQTYYQKQYAETHAKKEQALIGLATQKVFARLEAMLHILETVQPALHSQINASFRDSVLDAYHRSKSSRSVLQSLNELKAPKKSAKLVKKTKTKTSSNKSNRSVDKNQNNANNKQSSEKTKPKKTNTKKKTSKKGD